MARKTKDTAGLKLVTEEAQSLRDRFGELFRRTNKNEAKETDVDALRKLLRDNRAEELWREVGGLMSVAETFALDKSPVSAGLQECFRERLARVRKDLAGEGASPVEKLLAAQAAPCWLRLAETELRHTQNLSQQHTLALGVYYEKRLSMAQRRFTRAVETLERVRMMRRRAGQIGSTEAERRRA